jgi:hypothetical protein
MNFEHLPQHEPDPNLWSRIEANLSDTPVIPIGKSKPRRLSTWRWAAVAAGIGLVLVGYWSVRQGQSDSTERVTVAYSVEKSIASTPPAMNVHAEANRRTEAFIARQCLEQKPVCQKPEVHELRNQLVELKQEQTRIRKEMALFGADPALTAAQQRLENQRADVMKELVQLLQS